MERRNFIRTFLTGAAVITSGGALLKVAPKRHKQAITAKDIENMRKKMRKRGIMPININGKPCYIMVAPAGASMRYFNDIETAYQRTLI